MEHPTQWLLKGCLLGALLWVACLPPLSFAADDPTAESASPESLYLHGRYTQCLESIEQVLKEGTLEARRWRILKLRTLLELGRYDTAAEEAASILRSYPSSAEALYWSETVLRQSGRREQADLVLGRMQRLSTVLPLHFWEPPERVRLGQALLKTGEDPRRILELFFETSLKQQPDNLEAILAIGRLALDKHDYALAATHFEQGLARHADHPDLRCGLAAALRSTQPERLSALTEQILQINPHHAPTLLLLAEFWVDADQPDRAHPLLDRVIQTNPVHPLAWSLKAALAHLKGNFDAAAEARQKALTAWPANPEPDSLFGRKLSRHYRFLEGSQAQRRALELDPAYQPAKIRLAEDLLRLGEEEEGWKLVEEVRRRDGYSVLAYNLSLLQKNLSSFSKLASDGLLVRMDKREAAVYGQEVLSLLQDARNRLCKKYSLEPPQQVLVEIFPNAQDFAIRTFGLPIESGYLGVCFGNVITANSPASPAAGFSNWQAVLWHEFAHVVTLNKTRHRIPRWLSEGISVHEEQQHTANWGQPWQAGLRSAVLEGRLVPIAEMDRAFHSPPTPAHLQLAYFQAGLVVDFLIERSGHEALNLVLDDLAVEKPVFEAIEARFGKLAELETAFTAYARSKALNGLADESVLARPGANERVETRPAQEQWLIEHPKSLWAHKALGADLIRTRSWEEARNLLEPAVDLDRSDTEDPSVHALLSQALKQLGDEESERRILKLWSEKSSSAIPAYDRLIELDQRRQNWAGVWQESGRWLAVQPMHPVARRAAARSAEAMGKTSDAIRLYRSLLELDASDAAEIHYHLARLLMHTDRPAARRHLLESLSQAPRRREAYLVLEKVLEEPARP